MIRFTAIHELYQREEDAAKAELGRRLRRRADLVAEQQAIGAARLAAGRDLAPGQREQYVAFWRIEEGRIAALATAIQTQDQAIEEARRKLAEAHRKVATIAKLRERDRQALRRQEDRREQRRSDDWAALAHGEY
jgi:flagellar export protein FliJ